MSKNIRAETPVVNGATLSNNLPLLLAFLQKPEFQHLRGEFEQILDNYIYKSTRVSEEEIPWLIRSTAHDIKMMLKKAASIAREDEDLEHRLEV